LGGGIELSTGIRGGTRRPYLRFDISWGGYARLYRGERYRKLAAAPLNVFADATKNLLDEFLVALDSGIRPPNDAEDNRRTLALMFAAYQSSQTNTCVEIGKHVARSKLA
jgi:predicted dehydrogenase